jgi:hypothetical protein
LWRQPWSDGYESVFLARREVGQACRIRGDMLLLFAPALIGLQVGDVEEAVRVGAVDALGGEGLDVAVDAVLKRDVSGECLELGVLVVDDGRVGKVDGEDTDALGSCATMLSASALLCAWHAVGDGDVLILKRAGRLHRGHWNAAATTTHAGTLCRARGARRCQRVSKNVQSQLGRLPK